jgi:hypothetical protein
MRPGGGSEDPFFLRETGPASGAASGWAILRATQAFQSLRLIFLHLRQRLASRVGAIILVIKLFYLGF